MSRREVLSEAARRRMFLSPDALEIIMSRQEPLAFTNTVLQSLAGNPMFVTKEDVLACLEGDAPAFASPPEVRPSVRSGRSEIKVVDGTDITGNSTCEGTIEDFARYFQSRYSILKRIIERNRRFGQAVPIDRAMGMDREVRVIGMISSRKVTENKHLILEIEDDEGGSCNVLITSEKPFVNGVYVTDQVIGVIGKPVKRPEKGRDGREKKGMISATEIVNPDVPANHAWERSDSGSVVGFLSDVHIGSYTFLEKNWRKMIAWLKENSENVGLEYIVLPGDVVDGVGIFPGQEEELNIDSVFQQYDTLAEYLKEVPDHIQMVIHPGNHDACRPAEPQPALDKRFLSRFDSNVIMTGNPINLEIEGRRILSYHGRSIDDWISSVQQLTYDDPIAVMRQMMTMRHLAPVYGMKTALAPEKKDYMAIETAPDIFVSGHVHGAGYEDYRGIKLINASTWQDQTEYQKMHNFNPQPGIMPLVHLGSGQVRMRDFMKD